MKLPLLHLNDHAGWTRWLAAAKAQPAKALQGLVLNRPGIVIDAAVNGQGVALARTTLAAWDLISNRLVAPFAEKRYLCRAHIGSSRRKQLLICRRL